MVYSCYYCPRKTESSCHLGDKVPYVCNTYSAVKRCYIRSTSHGYQSYIVIATLPLYLLRYTCNIRLSSFLQAEESKTILLLLSLFLPLHTIWFYISIHFGLFNVEVLQDTQWRSNFWRAMLDFFFLFFFIVSLLTSW